MKQMLLALLLLGCRNEKPEPLDIVITEDTGGPSDSGTDTSADTSIEDTSVEDTSIEDTAEPDILLEGDIVDKLNSIPGMSASEAPFQQEFRYIEIYFEQPIDHENPNGEKFTQYMTLIHRDEQQPMILASTGYHNYIKNNLTEPATLFETNQLVIEHRYFDESIPENPDWSFLTIEQAAADHHRITRYLRLIYTGKWLSTGGSKGGMTSIYHRRFYPDDVDATIAYVAPLSFDAPDFRYRAFFDTTIDPSCVAQVRTFQHEAMNRWEALFSMYQQEIVNEPYSFSLAGSYEAAFEDMIRGFEWWFWQYMGIDSCSFIPQSNASDSEIYQTLLWQGYQNASDESLMPFSPYYYQASTQLGYPAGPDHLYERLQYPFENSLLPQNAGFYNHDPSAMLDIDNWVRTQGSEIMFIYGEYDPWTAGAFALGSATDSFSYTVSGGSHYANISDLSETDYNEAINTISRWLDVSQSKRLQNKTFVQWKTHRPTFFD